MNSITASMARAYSEGVALSQNIYSGDPREAPYVPELKYFDKLPGIFAKAKGKTLNEQADAVTGLERKASGFSPGSERLIH